MALGTLARPNVEAVAEAVVALTAAGLLQRTPEAMRAAAAAAGISVHAVGAAAERRRQREIVERTQRPNGTPPPPTPPPALPQPGEVLELAVSIVTERTGMPGDVLLGRSQRPSVAAWRHVVCAVMRELTGITYPALGELLERDHSTVISSVRRVETSPQLATEARVLAQEVKTRWSGNGFGP